MSNAVFPVLPGQTWPRQRVLKWPSTVKRANGRRYALSDQLYPSYTWRIPYSYLRTADFDTLAGFWRARGGALDSFLFDDRDDNTATAQPFGAGDGTSTTFQLVRSWGGVVEPVSAVNGWPAVRVAGNLAGNLLAPHTSFETDANTDGVADGWATYSAGTTGSLTYSLPTGGSTPYGSRRQRIDAAGLGTTASDAAGITRAVPLPAAVVGQACTFAADLKLDASANLPEVVLEIDWLTAGGGLISVSAGVVTVTTAGFTRQWLTATAPAGAAQAQVFAFMRKRNAVSAGAAALECDGMQLDVAANPAPYTALLASVAAGTGLVTFTGGAPANGAALSWDGRFYWRVAFAKAEQEFEEFMRALRLTKSVELETAP